MSESLKSLNNPAIRKVLDDEITARCEKSLYRFIREAWPVVEPAADFVPGWHIQALAEHLEAVSHGEIQNFLCMVPPGSTKTLTICVFFPAWEWIRNPSTRWLYASYSLGLAQNAAKMCGHLIKSKWYQERWGGRYKIVGDAVTELTNSSLGSRKCLSIGSRTTGEHGDRLIVDDPHNVKEAESDTVRQSTLEWHDKAWFNRVNNYKTSARVVVAQRTHEQDLLGHLEERGDYVTLRLPEEYDAGNPCVTVSLPALRARGITDPWRDPRKVEGELLRPDRFGPSQVLEAQKTLGSRGYASQYLQRPKPRDGKFFKKSWFKRYEDCGDHYTLEGVPGIVPFSHLTRFVLVDCAASEKADSDYTAIGTFGVTPKGYLLVLNMVRERMDVECVVPKVEDVCLRWSPLWVGIESNGFQIWFVKEARNKDRHPNIPAVRELKHEGRGKAARATPAAIQAEQGEIYLPPDVPTFPWLPAFEEELLRFTGNYDAHDDQVDVLAYACLVVDQYGYGSSETAEPILFE